MAARERSSSKLRVVLPILSQLEGYRSEWLPRDLMAGLAIAAVALPIGIESGFSSAGAGALGTVLLLNYSEMSPSEVVGTDILFGLVLAAIGSAIHLGLGSVSSRVLWQLLAAGIPGVLLGFLLARRAPAPKLKSAIALIAILAGMQLVWSGRRSLVMASSRQTVTGSAAPAQPAPPAAATPRFVPPPAPTVPEHIAK